MAEASTAPSAPVAPAETSSTPAAEVAPPATPETAPAVPASETPTPAPASREPAKADGVTPTPTTTEPAPLVGPLFKLPEDIKFNPAAVTLLETGLKPLVGADGKLNASPQQVADLLVAQAKDGQARWARQQVEQDQAWAAESKQRFSSQQLAASETGLGFLASFDREFREVAKQFKNHPSFVNAMRIVGERLKQDTFEIDGTPAPASTVKRTPAERMGYAKPKTN